MQKQGNELSVVEVTVLFTLAVSTVKIVGEDDSEAMMNGGDVDVTRS